jgi:hypothetical protein
VRTEADRDQGFEFTTEGAQVDLGAEASNDPSCTQAPDPLQTRRRGGAGERSEVLVGGPSILLERFENQPICSIKAHLQPQIWNEVRILGPIATSVLGSGLSCE